MNRIRLGKYERVSRRYCKENFARITMDFSCFRIKISPRTNINHPQSENIKRRDERVRFYIKTNKKPRENSAAEDKREESICQPYTIGRRHDFSRPNSPFFGRLFRPCSQLIFNSARKRDPI